MTPDRPAYFVSPDGLTVAEVASPVVAVRLRARGWLPLDEARVDAPPAADAAKLTSLDTDN